MAARGVARDDTLSHLWTTLTLTLALALSLAPSLALTVTLERR